jgi:hypothetical protein
MTNINTNTLLFYYYWLYWDAWEKPLHLGRRNDVSIHQRMALAAAG